MSEQKSMREELRQCCKMENTVASQGHVTKRELIHTNSAFGFHCSEIEVPTTCYLRLASNPESTSLGPCEPASLGC